MNLKLSIQPLLIMMSPVNKNELASLRGVEHAISDELVQPSFPRQGAHPFQHRYCFELGVELRRIFVSAATYLVQTGTGMF
mmetsp:Transcript_1588/g.3026  ORF Transcript_1588/g.3026 Transcript_1588/m.3026 type:complete len:81 (-) Transcript_1588:31-273(-)